MNVRISDEALQYLEERDPQLGRYIRLRGKILRKAEPDVFAALVQSIMSQQISGKAFATVYARFLDVCPAVSPNALCSVDENILRACGISAAKVRNIKAAAGYFLQQAVTAAYFSKKSDDEIIRELVQLPGVGVWTAEMLLLFSLQRPNILSYGDYGIKKGLCVLHGLEKLDKKQFLRYKELYSPYGSAASLYLWEIANTAQG